MPPHKGFLTIEQSRVIKVEDELSPTIMVEIYETNSSYVK